MKKTLKFISAAMGIIIFVCSFAMASISAATSYKGSGTKNDPYLVETVEQLKDIRYNLSAHYKLANTIDLSSVKNFTPIGNLEKPFTGTFVCELNADNTPKYIIKNLKITVEETADVGQYLNRWECALFGAANGAAFSGIYVFDVKLVNKNFGDNTGAVIYGDYKRGMDEMNCAALVGQANSCVISNCASTGVIDGSASYSGGLIGYCIDSQVSYCYSTAKVSSESIFAVGGLMGATRTSSVEKCYSTGNVVAGNRGSASFVGSVYSSTYLDCYTTGDVTAPAMFITNFTGDRESGTSSYENCYATGTVKGGGRQEESANVKNCYTLSGVKSNMKGFKEASKAEIKATFSKLSGWDASGELPTIKDIGVVEDAGAYKPNAVSTEQSGSTDEASSSQTASTSSAVSTSSPTESVQSQATTFEQVSTHSENESKSVLADFVAAVEKLPAPEQMNSEKLNDVITAQKLYEQLTETDLIDLDNATRIKFTNIKNAVQKDVLITLKEGIEKLPETKKLKAKHKDEVLYLGDLFSILSDEGKTALSPKLTEKLNACIEKAKTFEESKETNSAISQTELVYDIVLTALIVLLIAFCVFNSIRTFRLMSAVKNANEEEE